MGRWCGPGFLLAFSVGIANNVTLGDFGPVFSPRGWLAGILTGSQGRGGISPFLDLDPFRRGQSDFEVSRNLFELLAGLSRAILHQYSLSDVIMYSGE